MTLLFGITKSPLSRALGEGVSRKACRVSDAWREKICRHDMPTCHSISSHYADTGPTSCNSVNADTQPYTTTTHLYVSGLTEPRNTDNH